MATRGKQRHGKPRPLVLQRGIGLSGDRWELSISLEGQDDCLELFINGTVASSACGFDIPATTEVGFGGGLKPGHGDFYLYGLTSARVGAITAVSAAQKCVVRTKELPSGARRADLRFFILVRESVEDVDALVAWDFKGRLVQRLDLPKAID